MDIQHCERTATSAAKSFQSCLTLCDPVDSSPPGSSVPGILQARILEWAAISFSEHQIVHFERVEYLNKAFKNGHVAVFCNSMLLLLSHFSRVRLCVTPETAAHQAPWSLGFSRQEHCSRLPFPSPLHESEN